MAAAPNALPLAWIPGVTTWLVVWLVLAVSTVAIVALMRTRWREVRPWKKCALLSLWVHVLLACMAINVRIGVGGAGAGIGPGAGGPIRVAIVSVAPDTTDPDPVSVGAIASETASDAEVKADDEDVVEASPAAADANAELAPALEAKPEPAPAAASTDAIVLEAAAPPIPVADIAIEAPDLLPQPKPEPELSPDLPTAPKDVSPPAQVATTSKESVEASPNASHGATTSETNTAKSGAPIGPAGALVDPDASPRAGVPAAYASRFADRDALVSGGGGNPTTERAVRAALAWLAAGQSEDGHWDPKRFGAGQERYVLGENRGAAGAKADTGITALALLAFMGAGHTHREGPYADNVARGLDYLRRKQGGNGNLGGDAEFFAHMYCHSMATFALAEACAITRDAKLKPIVERAVAYSLAAQHPTQGGWRYKANPGADGGDTSQLGWQLMALKSAELAGVSIPAVTWTRVERFLRNVERGAAGGLAAYRPEGPPSRAMTAEALFCRQLITHRADGGLPRAALDEARKALLDEPPGGVVVNFYYWYYATAALHRAQRHSSAAAEAWQRWNEALTETLVTSQASDGSWSSACLWGGYGGRVYTTSIAAMCLEVYYRYADDEAEPRDVARRDQWQTVPPH